MEERKCIDFNNYDLLKEYYLLHLLRVVMDLNPLKSNSHTFTVERCG